MFRILKSHTKSSKKSEGENTVMNREDINRETFKKSNFSYKNASDKCKKVFMSNRAYASIVAEAYANGKNETGGVLLGHEKNGFWYVVEATDPGFDAMHTLVNHAFNDKYVNYVYRVVSRLYQKEPYFKGIWHRHPGGFNRFSSLDDTANTNHAKVVGNGTLSFILNFINNSPKLTCYYLDMRDMAYHSVKLVVGDSALEKEGFLQLATPEDIHKKAKRLIEERNEVEMDDYEEDFFDVTKQMVDGHFSETDIPCLAVPEETEDSSIPKINDKAYYININEDIYNNKSYTGPVYGKFIPEALTYYAFSTERGSGFDESSAGIIVTPEEFIRIHETGDAPQDYDWFGTCFGEEWCFNCSNPKMSLIAVKDKFSFVAKAFSRNAGLLDSDKLKDKTAIILGQGSVGSYISTQLVRAGVGHLVLIDGDTLEIHNLSRHCLNLRHIGEYKVNAMKEELLQINPTVDIKTFSCMLKDVPEGVIEEIAALNGNGIVISTGDNRKSAAEANALAENLGYKFIATGCWLRAHAGEVFYWKPDCNLPVYADAFDGLISDERNEAHRMYLGQENDADQVSFEPGIYSDICFVTEVAIKLALDFLSDADEGASPARVFRFLTNYTLVCNTNEPAFGGETAELFPTPLFITGGQTGMWLRNKGDAANLDISLYNEKEVQDENCSGISA